MTVTCPKGHLSATTDYCDQCGDPISVAPEQPTEILPVLEDPDTSTSTSPAARRERCPVCDTERSGEARYCEACGHDFLAPTSNATAWEAIVDADPAWFDRSSSDGLTFPAVYRRQRLTLDRERLRIGRSQAAYVDAAFGELAGASIQSTREWENWTRAQRQLVPLEPEPLGSLEGILRPYQKEGVYWLRFLSRNGLGGILAD